MLVIKNDYEVIALGALLHDIGKLLNRCDSYINERKKVKNFTTTVHQAMSSDFIDLLDEYEILKKNELVKTIVQRHHELPTMNSEFKVQDLKKGHERNLAYLVSRADNYSSSERHEKELSEKSKSSFKTTPLDSILHTLSIYNEYKLPITKYKLNPYNYQNLFPSVFEKNEQEDLTYIVRNFLKEVKEIKCNDFESFYMNMYSILKKYTWSIPSDTQKYICDISLFDHLKTTSAIAIANYLYHKQTNTLDDENKIKKDDEDKFVIVGFCLEGAGKYIEDIKTNKNNAKRLRGKSFYINLLTQSISHKIIKRLNLTMSNIILDMGDRFFIIAQKTQDASKIIIETRKEINNYLYNKFEGELYLNAAVESTSGKKLKNFSDILDNINYKLENNKQKIHIENVLKNPIIDNKFKIGGVCKTCDKMLIQKGYSECEFCKDEINIATYLSKTKYIGFYNNDIDFANKITLFDEEKTYVAFFDNEEEIIDGTYLIYNIKSTDILNSYPSGFKFYANYVPKKDDITLTFEDISKFSKGTCNIGVAKIKIDDLDMLMSIGLIDVDKKSSINTLGKREDDENEENLHDYTTISRLSTLYESINAFLNNYIYNKFENSTSEEVSLSKDTKVNINLSNHYVLNNTNDTLIIVGPWNEIMFTAKFINDEFNRFTGYNKDVSMSCGIAIVKSKEPIKNALNIATKNLENAISNEGDGVVVFDKFIKWSKFDEVFDLGEFISKNMKIDSYYGDCIYAQSFVYRLLNYTNMAKEYKLSNYQNIESLMYISKLEYDISRNLLPKIASRYNLDINNKEDREKAYQKKEVKRLYKYFNDREFLYSYMDVVLNYAVRKNRGR